MAMAGSTLALPRDWRLVALVGALCFPLSLAVVHIRTPVVAWLIPAPGIVAEASTAGLITLSAMVAALMIFTRRLRAHSRRMRVALNNMSQGLCMFDSHERLVVCNRRYTEMYGLPPKPHGPVRPCGNCSNTEKPRAASRAMSRSTGAISSLRWCKATRRAKRRNPTMGGRSSSTISRCRVAAGWRRTRISPSGAAPSASVLRCKSRQRSARRSSKQSPASAAGSKTCSAR